MAQLKAQLAAFQDAVADPAQEPIAVAGDCCTSCCSGGAYADLELLFFKSYESDGVTGTDNNVGGRYDFELAPRITLGYDSGCGYDVRLRYFHWDHNGPVGAFVDTYNIDLEIAKEVCICDAAVEFSTGLRYNEYRHRDANNIGNLADEYFSGAGIIMGIQTRYCVCSSTLYARARHSILVGDSEDPEDGEIRNDVVLSQLELGTGVEVDRCIAGMNTTLRLGVEFQDYFSYEDEDEDVGFFGFVLGGTVRY